MTSESANLARLLRNRTKSKDQAEREAEVLATLPAETRDAVIKQLRTLDAFMTAQAEKKADPTMTAEKLGVTVRSLYRLVQRIEERGPITALAPAKGSGRKRRSDAGATLSKKVVDAITDQVFRYPQQPLGQLVSKIRQIDPDASPSTIRRRALQFRKSFDPLSDLVFGRSWLLDQAAVRIPVKREDGIAWLVAAFLIDVETGLVCGRAIVNDQGDPGFGALLYALGRMAPLLGRRLNFACDVSDVTWAVPDGRFDVGEAVEAHAAGLDPPIRLTTLMNGKFRRGSRLASVMGGAIGTADIMVRATVDPNVGLNPGVLRPLSEHEALAELDREIIHANRIVSRWAQLDEPIPSPQRVTQLQYVLARLVDVFEPALDREETSRARGLIGGIVADGQPRLF